MVQVAFSSSLRDVSDDVSKQLKLKNQSETTEYILLYGKYEPILSSLGYQIERLLKTTEFSFGQAGERNHTPSYISQWHELYRQIQEAYLKSRESVGPLVLKNLRKFGTKDPKPEADFTSFARGCVQYVFDICHNELSLMRRFFHGGPLLAEYLEAGQGSRPRDYVNKLEENRLSHLTTLHNYLSPYLGAGDLQRICDLTSWLETMYLSPNDGDVDGDQAREDRRSVAQQLLSKHLWPLSDELFLKAATEIEHFKPAQEDLIFSNKHTHPMQGEASQPAQGNGRDEQILAYDVPTPAVSNAYPTVKTAVRLLIMYNDGVYERPVSDNPKNHSTNF